MGCLAMQTTKNWLVLKKYFFTLTFISWTVFITLLSLFSFSEASLPRVSIPNVDKLVHAAFYFGVVVLGCLFIREISQGKISKKKGMTIMGLFAVIYGIVIEVLQGALTQTREADFLDALANSVGVLLGLFLINVIFSGKTAFKWND